MKNNTESLGTSVRKYVARKFGEHEASRVVLEHESIRWIITQFVNEWIPVLAQIDANWIAGYSEGIAAPVDMIIFCPKCLTQHIDAPDPGKCMDCGIDAEDHPNASAFETKCLKFNPWLNPPHRKHRCCNCNHVFAVTETLKTNGVKELPQ